MTDSPPQALRRTLKPRHIQMIALGGAIGTGLFYGSAESIGLAGPSVLLTYLIGGAVIFLVVRALGEMSVDDPVSGAFSHYANVNWSARAGFVSGWNYWFNYIAVSMVELSVVGSFVNYWLPDVPTWVSATIFLVLITGVNLVGVRVFGETEFWLACVKVAAVIGLIVLGIVVVVLGINHSADLPDPSFAHLWDQGGFFPLGAGGTLFALVVVMFSFGGTELIGITAGEAERPERTIPRAINQVVLRVLIFYVGALAVIMAVVPWNQLDGSTSPFVQIFDRIGVPGAAHILNLVMLTAVISVYNSGLYANGRMLYALALQGNAPRYLRRVSRSGIPISGVLTSSAVTALAVVVVFLWPEFAFQILMSVALIAAIINWSMIMITQLKFRARIGPAGAAALTFRLPFARVTPWLVLAFFACLLVLMCFHPGYRTAVLVGPIWLAVLLVAFEVQRRRRAAA
ncbi:amino acid permease [Leucobacter chromiireducens]|nr:amino acid permease [Leucobacter chromiireducens]